MGSYEDAIRENRRLKAEAQVREAMEKRRQDTRAIQRENWALKNPGLHRVLGGVRAVAVKAGKNVARNSRSRSRSSGFSLGINRNFFN